MSNRPANELGVLLPSGCKITYGTCANIKKPFAEIDLTMHELSPSNAHGFSGQLGFISFNSALRLPRHIHMDTTRHHLVAERILVLHGVGMVELAGEVFVVAPGSLVDIRGGVPHTWTACPAGVRLPADGTVSQGEFTMVYKYEETTAFFPTGETKVVQDVGEYIAWEGDLAEIRFPEMSREEVVEKGRVVLDQRIHGLSIA